MSSHVFLNKEDGLFIGSWGLIFVADLVPVVVRNMWVLGLLSNRKASEMAMYMKHTEGEWFYKIKTGPTGDGMVYVCISRK